MENTTNELLEALLNGDTENIVPRSRVETFLLAMCEKMGGSGGGLPHVTLTTAPTAEGVALTDEENALLNEALANKTPIILTVNCVLGTLTAIAFVSFFGDTASLVLVPPVAGGLGFTLENTGGENNWMWTAYIDDGSNG